MRNRVGFADVGEELVAEAFTLGRASYQSGDIDKFNDRRDHLLRFDDDRQRGESRIGYFDNADIGLDGAERIVFRCNTGLGQGIEQGGFADVG